MSNKEFVQVGIAGMLPRKVENPVENPVGLGSDGDCRPCLPGGEEELSREKNRCLLILRMNGGVRQAKMSSRNERMRTESNCSPDCNDGDDGFRLA